MRITKLVLTGYKPLMIHGMKSIVITDMGNIVLVLGPNGYGKSSILRQMTPYPATRTDYVKGGKKVITIDHDCKEFVLTSDFESQRAHSFLIDGQEMNLSGNTDVQESLVRQYFDFPLIISKIMSGKFKFCSMTKSQRKELLYATYPFQLDFVLEKYKALMSKIKAGNAQLKLLHERKLKLSGSMLNPETKEEYIKQSGELTKQINEMEKELFHLEQSIKKSKSELDLIRARIPVGMDTDDYKSKAELLSAKMKQIYKHRKDLALNADQLHDSIVREITQMSALHGKSKELQDMGISLRDEIEKYKASCNDDTEEQIKTCESLIEAQKTIIRDNVVDPNVPIVMFDELEKLKQAISYISSDLMYLKSLACEMWDETKYEAYATEIRNLEYQISQENSFVSRGEALLIELQRKYDKNNQYSYPLDCKRGCHLRENLENILNAIKAEMDKCKTDTESTKVLLEQHKAEYEAKKSELQARAAARPILLRLDRSISSKSWGDYVCSGVSMIEAVNTNVTEINNRLVKIIQNTETSLVVKKAQEILTGLEAKLVGLKSTTKPMKEMITKVLIQKELQLKRVTDDISKLNDQIKELEDVHNIHSQHEALVKEINELVEQFNWYKQGVMLKTEIEYYSNIMSELTRKKNEVGSKLRELEAILKEQEGYSIRLNDEIEPNILKIERSNAKLQLVADEICPTSGLPCASIVKYVNALLHRANQYLRQMWSYDMELSYFDEDDLSSFDFTFPILINKDSKVSDASLASRGMASGIDMAIMMAMASYLKLANRFPMILDEYTEGLQPSHVQTSTELIGKYMRDEQCQAFIVSHDAIMNANFIDATYITLTEDDQVPPTAKIISKIINE